MKWRRLLFRPVDPASAVKTLILLAVSGAAFAIAVVGLGLYNVSAKSGHWPGAGWVLHTTFHNAVRLRAKADPPENLRSADMVALGAGHFDTGCRPCHASPGSARSATMQAMEPEPPHITEAVKHWEPDELHWIVHQGIKMTGMPGWPADRGDDVWPVVSFLIESRNMKQAEYQQLTEKPGGSTCAMCHGENGRSRNAQIPRIDILSQEYIAQSLAAYKSGKRDSGIMAQALSDVPEDAIDRIANRLAGYEPAGTAQAIMTETGRLGRELAANGGSGDIPACRACHGPWPEKLNPLFPSLAGQHAPYLRQQLTLWRDAQRGGGKAAALMHHAARGLTDEDIAALADYYSSLAPAKLDDTRE